MWTYVEIDGKSYVTEEDYLNMVKYYENSLSAERNGAKKDKEELKKKLNILKKRVERNDAIIDELLVAEEWTDIQWILEKEYEFSPFNDVLD